MVKKGGQPKGGKPGGGGGKKTSTSSKPAEGSDFIVFTNSDKETKPKKSTNAVSQGEASTTAQSTEQPKPTMRQLVGPSWTGKLPVNMLNEHCTRERWERPEYSMIKTKEGFSCIYTLKARNPKTQEITRLPPLKIPPTHKHLLFKPSALEARHVSATYALFRVCSMRNIHMALPPQFRDLWKGEFQTLKKQDIENGNAWLYEADPFTAFREREDAKAEREKKRNELDKAKQKTTATPGTAIDLGLPNGVSKSMPPGGHIHRGWARVPKIEMGKRIRVQVEDIVRKHAIWNPHGLSIPQVERHVIASEFKNLDFRESHVQEALDLCKDRHEALTWLLIHIPEDDLPQWALPPNYLAGISVGSTNLKKEGAIKRLAKAGYSLDLCKQVYDAQGKEAEAAEALQTILISGSENVTQNILQQSAGSLELSGTDKDWEDELESVGSVFGDRFTRLSSHVCQVQLKPSNRPHDLLVVPILQIQKSKKYPQTLPVITLEAKLPAYIRLAIMKKALLHALENLLGEPMLFFIIDWIEEYFYSIVDQPGKLRDISAAAASTVSRRDTGARKMKSVKRHPPPIKWLLNPSSRNVWIERQRSSKYQSMLAQRKSLPAWEMRDKIVECVSTHQVVIISGETGSGKSTQTSQFILDDLYQKGFGEAASIICTQPRRISALSLADRVSEERCSIVGTEIGYQIRGESKTSPKTKITFVTTGVLLRRLQTSGGSGDDVVASLNDCSHIIIDEVHERSLDTDFLLVLLRDVLKQRQDLRLILMSATLDAGVFEEYFNTDGKVGRVEISGRTFPIEDYYLDHVISMTGFNPGRVSGRVNEDDADTAGMESSVANVVQSMGMGINYDLIMQTVKEIDAELSHAKQDGGILIFLPGVAEITRTIDYLRSIPNLHVLPLHASLQSIEQKRVFLPPPSGRRKVIASTNVAETSITVEDIVAVIDSGRVKETSFDPSNNMRKLEEVWVSRAAAKQRRGRAGRVQAGKCYKLYTRNAELTKMIERPEPEIRRVPLEQLCLSVRAMGIVDVPQFLGNALTPPDSLAVDGAMDLLSRMGALDGQELTALGRHLSMIPADLRCGKLMVYGSIFHCLDACVTIAAILTVKSPFVSPQDKRDEAKAARSVFSGGHGDLIADLRAFEKWDKMVSDRAVPQREVRNWCSTYFLSYQTLNDIASNRTQLMSSLHEIGFSPRHPNATLNSQNDNTALIRSLIAGAFNPQVARIEFPEKKFAPSVSGAVELDPEAKTIKYFNQENGRVFVHPSSTLFDAQGFPGNAVFMSYFNKMATSKVFIRDLTPFNSYTALLFSGPISLDTLGRGLLVDGWLRLRGWARIGVLVNQLRRALDDVLAQKIDNPDMDLSENEVVAIVTKLIELDGMDQ